MNNFFYSKLAVQNLKNNRKTYVPYILTCIFTTAMFFVVGTIANIKWADSDALHSLLTFALATVGIFSAIFLFYTNSFLIKQRKKEFGLYNILGMEKRHIAKILFIETAYTYIFGTAAGIAIGALFSKLTFLLLLKILKFGGNIDFRFYQSTVDITALVFGAIALLNLAHNLLCISLSNPVKLLKGGNKGEKEPKAKVLTAVLGAACLASGYTIALVVKSPITAMGAFFAAVLLVIVGTFMLFSSGSIWILKALRKNKKYYYKAKHFTSVSSMIYRMKQNAAGLASICILSTAVLVTVSTTVSLYAGTEDIMRTRYPRNIYIDVQNATTENCKDYADVMTTQAQKYGMESKNELYYRYLSFSSYANDSGYTATVTPDYNDGLGVDIVTLIPVSEYNRITGKNETLQSDEVLSCTPRGKAFSGTVKFGDDAYKIKHTVDVFPTIDSYSAFTSNYSYYIVSDEKAAMSIYNSMGYKSEGADASHTDMSFAYGFDTDAPKDVQKGYMKDISLLFCDISETSAVDLNCAETSRDSMMSLYGGLFFIGITLGLLFLVATVLIIYYKQISEGYDDKQRYVIMQNVGMSKKEVKKSIHSQVLTVFFLPLVTAVIHICFGFKVITKLLKLLNLSNVTLFFWCTVATISVFAIIYVLVYAVTARTYYRIVEDKNQ